MEGESLFNDASSMVLFTILFSITQVRALVRVCVSVVGVVSTILFSITQMLCVCVRACVRAFGLVLVFTFLPADLPPPTTQGGAGADPGPVLAQLPVIASALVRLAAGA